MVGCWPADDVCFREIWKSGVEDSSWSLLVIAVVARDVMLVSTRPRSSNVDAIISAHRTGSRCNHLGVNIPGRTLTSSSCRKVLFPTGVENLSKGSENPASDPECLTKFRTGVLNGCLLGLLKFIQQVPINPTFTNRPRGHYIYFLRSERSWGQLGRET